MTASCGTCMAWRIIPPRTLVAVHTPCVWAHDLSCEAEACRARGGSSCEAETCRGCPFSGELVSDAANWPKTARLSIVGLDQGPFSSLS
jgi:hypothetical protein